MQYKFIGVKAIIRANLLFFIPYVLFLIAGGCMLIANSKGNIHLEFNSFHDSFFDVFFYYATFLGDGVIAVLAGLILLTVRYRWAIVVGLSNIISAVITQTLKHTVFSDVVRPKKFFEGVHDLYFVPNVDNYLYNSFPSGHSTCAFALYLSVALITKNKTLKLACILLALVVGYSRIYLSQHFLEDVYAGSLIGVVTTLFVFFFIQRSQVAWLNRSLINRK
ncbi:MAG: phosphoesterase PA-phosphatase related [Bacteroidetes bacterium]|nr:phosphoesterase PA-phosphatase related [Bacteroidota bacterium]